MSPRRVAMLSLHTSPLAPLGQGDGGGMNVYVRALGPALAAAGLRATVDDRQEKVNLKIREAQLQKVPYMLVVGDREAAEGAVAVRSRAQGDLGARPVPQFVHEALAEVDRKQVF